MVRKNKNRHSSGGRGGRIGSGPSSTVSCSIPELQKFVPGESLKRPGFVSAGESYIVKANHFKLTYNETLCRYHVLIDPKPTSAGDVMIQLAKLYGQSRLGGRLRAYDGKKSLYTSRPFPFTCEAFKVTLPDQENILCGLPRGKRHFRVQITLDKVLFGRIDSEEFYQAFNTILRELFLGRYCLVGRSFYKSQPGEGLKNCCGFYQRIQNTQMGISLNIDISCKPFINPLPVINLVALLLNRDISDDPFDFCERLKVSKDLCDVEVNFTLEKNADKKYRITGLTSQGSSQLPCPCDDSGTGKTVVEYFKETYRRTIWSRVPCLKVRDQEKPTTYLPMEVCEISDAKQISYLLSVACQHPMDHEKTILQTVNPYNEDPHAKEFGITFENKLTIVKGRVLPPPVLKFNDQGKVKEFLPKVGKWNMRLKQMVKGGEVNTWACINFASDITHAAAVAFCDELAVMCVISGMNFKGDPVLPLVNAKPNHVRPFLKKHYQRFMEILRPLHKELDLLIVILPDKNGTLYGDIKRICETDLGLVSQCCLAKHVLKMKPQYLTNIALKINMKVGGRNTVLLDAVVGNLPRVSNTPTIIFGADVSHPHHGEGRSSPSIAAVVASQDWPEVTNYAGLVRPQARHEEIIQGLFNENDCGSGCISGGMIKEHLISFMRSTGHIPRRIIFYRDVVSKGRLNMVLEHELSAIKKKQHHTRLFAGNYGVGSTIFQSGNVLPGTVVDKEICHPTDFDFYLCSHAGTKGVSRPVRYHVLWDENNFTANALQILTNHLCYTDARCTSSVSIVPPVHYAHLLASRARLYIGYKGKLPDIKDNVKKRGMFFC
ncbi:hypothetical protein CFC21_011248 [Triticum aestivum]|uniref:Piwi domain-containing protein n=3 Tax=Triticinae TaxID=1648030 RepID=A0A9R1DMM4_WHEAT|nr:protein argonaute 1B-like isoform X2 [Triticum aestivum]KAF6994582.1 hypothetical protein CFC21_011248 [Triticum aestivum]